MPAKKKKTSRSAGQSKTNRKPVNKTVQLQTQRETSVFTLGDHGKKLMWTLFGIFLVYCVIWMATLIRNNLQEYHYISQSAQFSKTIVVTETADVSIEPDIAKTTIGMVSSGETVKEAQDANTKVMNEIISSLKALGIQEKDMQTAQYNVYPKYRYTEEDGRVEDGYEVSQNVRVIIRDLTKANQVIALAGEVGANTVGGLQFEIDDPDVFIDKARDKALHKVKQKAMRLSRSLGVEIVGVMTYNEYQGGGRQPIAYKEYAMDQAAGESAPSIEPGQSKVEMTVSVTYEIR